MALGGLECIVKWLCVLDGTWGLLEAIGRYWEGYWKVSGGIGGYLEVSQGSARYWKVFKGIGKYCEVMEGIGKESIGR